MFGITLNLKKKYIGAILATLILVFLFIIAPDITLAETAPTAEQDKIGSSWYESILWSFVNGFFGLLVWLAGMLLNFSIGQFVVGFGDLFKSQGLGFAVDHLWSLVRDIFNLTFIFGLVYIGFKLILRQDDSSARQMLVYIILAALLVNFSLFFAKAVVDFSNIAATQVAQAFYNGSTGNYEVADQFMNVLGLSDIWQTNGVNLQNLASNKAGGISYIFGTMILFIITAFVFFAGALMLLVRFVQLNIYLILSPVMFLGWVFPNLGGYAKEYWNGFLKKAFFAPAYLLMLYFAYYILKEFNGLISGQNSSFAGVFTGNGASDFNSTIPYFFMTCIFLLAAVVVAEKMGGDAAKWVVSASKSTMKLATYPARKTADLATYPARAIPRHFVNNLGERTTKKFNSLQTRDGLIGKLAKTNFVDNKVRTVTEAATNAQFYTGTTDKTERETAKAIQSRANQTKASEDNTKLFKEANTALDNTAASTTTLTNAFKDLEKSLRSMSIDDKVKLGHKELSSARISFNLSDTDIENLEKSGKFDSTQIKGIKESRNDAFKQIATNGNILGTSYASAPDQRASIVSKNVKDIGKMPIDVFRQKNMYANLTPAMLEERMKNGVSTKDIVDMREALSQYLQIQPDSLPTGQTGKDRQWSKWASSNSNWASQFFQ